MASAPTDSSSSDTPTSIASAPHRLQRIARMVTCRATQRTNTRSSMRVAGSCLGATAKWKQSPSSTPGGDGDWTGAAAAQCRSRRSARTVAPRFRRGRRTRRHVQRHRDRQRHHRALAASRRRELRSRRSAAVAALVARRNAVAHAFDGGRHEGKSMTTSSANQSAIVARRLRRSMHREREVAAERDETCVQRHRNCWYDRVRSGRSQWS